MDVESLVSHNLSALLEQAHTANPLLKYISGDGVPIPMTKGVKKNELYKALRYVTHSLDLK